MKLRRSVPRRERAGQRVVGQGEVIHADRHVAGGAERVEHLAEQRQLQVRVGQPAPLQRRLVRRIQGTWA